MFYLARSFTWSSNGYYRPNEELRLYASMAQCDGFFRQIYTAWMQTLARNSDCVVLNMPTDGLEIQKLGEAAHFYSFEATLLHDEEENTMVALYCWNTVHLVPDRLAPAFDAARATDVLYDFYRNNQVLYVKTNYTNVEVSYVPYPEATESSEFVYYESYDKYFSLRLEK